MSSVPDESIVQNGIQLPGERLLIAREAQGLSQQSIADELHLPVRYIQWIEEGSYEKLPSFVFARGYIRGYSKIVGIDGSSLIELFDQLSGLSSKKEPIRSVTRIQQQVKLGDPVMRWSSWLFLLVIVSAIGWWWKTQYSLAPVDGVGPDVSAITAEMSDDKTLVLPKFEDSLEGSVVSEDANAEMLVEQNTAEEPQYLSEEDVTNLQGTLSAAPDTDVSLPVVEEAPIAVSDKLQITFTDDCWLTVKDADGKTIFNNLRKQGQSLSLSGKEPLRVLIGRVSAINQVLYNGVVVDLAPHNDKNVAKFSLPLN